MNRLRERIESAKQKWEELQTTDEPVVYIGAASCGKAAGAVQLVAQTERFLKENNVSARIVQVGCIGPCYLEPLVDIRLPGQPRVSYNNVTPKSLTPILQSSFIEKKVYTKGAIGHFGKNPLDGIPRFFDLPMLKPQVRVVLRNCGLIDPEEIDHYLAVDGYQGLMKALAMTPEEVIATVRMAGLRGRGGAGFPTFKKWTFCRSAAGEQKYLICNADEGDPGAFMNRSLVESDPHAVLEGMLIAGYAIGASKGIIYIRAEYPLAIERLKNALQQMREYGLLGKSILGSDFNFDIKIKEGAGAFVCGEETALIASIEGKRGMPRSRPPFPAIAGLFGCPTIINNVETLGTLPNIFRNGVEWYTRLGKEGNRGTKTFSLVGKIRRPGLIEVQLGTTLREIIYDIGGGLQKPFKAIQTGGPSGGCLSEEFLDLTVDYESLAAAGSIMGSGGLIVMDEDTCIVDLAKYFLDFTQKESCGKCTPCRIGTRHMVELLEKIAQGEGSAEDLLTLRTLGDTIRKGALCGLGQTAPNPVLTTLRYFRNEYLEHIKDQRCRAVVCKNLIEYRVIQEKCTGCQSCVRVCPTGAISGPRSEPHNLDTSKCIKCRSCYEICRFDAIAGDAIVIRSAEKKS
ncbi:MAG: NADP-reducing hydrogenase subunit HndC [Syntrophorhabdaceae bacterium PtaU1.Bin034]|jgi:NADH:ubiquinone oxidoreductase subunit F (NADH-binding)/NAD-dependent dihydropyrimidine dehydrogenase PreA subunit/(2Fe-2S) ferredoxin|nr:MAG: NADP-reducing hydrogenase subunit HndC [Syntrophorhabdaceae bacterium PtaU1.Bin034]